MKVRLLCEVSAFIPDSIEGGGRLPFIAAQELQGKNKGQSVGTDVAYPEFISYFIKISLSVILFHDFQHETHYDMWAFLLFASCKTQDTCLDRAGFV